MRKLVGLFLIALLSGTSWLSAQCGFFSPEPTCVRVMPNGNVEVDYTRINMGGPLPTDIDSFILEYSSNGVTWLLANRTTIAVSGTWPSPDRIVYTKTNEQNINPAYFRIRALCAGPPQTELAPSAVIQAVKLSSIITNDFQIDLTWNWNLLPPNLTVTVQRDLAPFPAPAWNAVGSPSYLQDTMKYTDTVVSCLDTVMYRIHMVDPIPGCSTISSIAGPMQIKDNTDPIKVVIDTITYDPVSNRPIINWSQSSDDTEGYYILFHSANDCQNYVVVDSVIGRTNTKLTDVTAWNGIGSAQYSLVPFDVCDRTAQPSDCESAIFLTSILDVCQKSVRLDWNHYTGFASGTDVLYRIFVSVGGSNFIFVDETIDDFYEHLDPIENTILVYKLVAVENGGAGPATTSSNQITVDAEFLKQPKMEYLRYATVVDKNKIRLELYTDIESDAVTYTLKKGLDTTDVFLPVNIFHAPDPKIPADSIIFMIDESSLTDNFQYYYRVDLSDSCGDIMTTSNVASTIYLKITANQTARINKLEWTNVFGWEGGTFSYKINRFLDGVLLKDPLTKFPDSGRTTVFYDSLLLINDNITAGNPSQGQYCYLIEASENDPSFPLMKPAKSYSNHACVIQEPYASKSNAFTPNGDGKNEVFKPVVIYQDLTGYEFYVMNRFGEVIFLTTSVDVPWDGTYGGKDAPIGAYVYSVKYRSSTGQSFEDIGTVTLLR